MNAGAGFGRDAAILIAALLVLVFSADFALFVAREHGWRRAGRKQRRDSMGAEIMRTWRGH